MSCQPLNLPPLPKCADKSNDIVAVIWPNGHVSMKLDATPEQTARALSVAAKIKQSN